jgi:2-amino-4-hydroxy-6-hydroxymethyldihydropteridine diphosphokinase
MFMQAILIALGANLASTAGPPEETLRAALRELSRAGVRIADVSPFYRTQAWPDPTDPPFVNAVARVETERTPVELMRLLHETETLFGRTRSARNTPRTLDLDLIDYRGRVEDGPPKLPHPRMDSRAFVLMPLAAIAPDWRHPVSGAAIERLIRSLPTAERDAVVRID